MPNERKNEGGYWKHEKGVELSWRKDVAEVGKESEGRVACILIAALSFAWVLSLFSLLDSIFARMNAGHFGNPKFDSSARIR